MIRTVSIRTASLLRSGILAGKAAAQFEYEPLTDIDGDMLTDKVDEVLMCRKV